MMSPLCVRATASLCLLQRKTYETFDAVDCDGLPVGGGL